MWKSTLIGLLMIGFGAERARAQPYVEVGANIGHACLMGEASCADEVLTRGMQVGIWFNEQTALRFRYLDAPRPDLAYPHLQDILVRWSDRSRSLWLGELTWHFGALAAARLFPGVSVGARVDRLTVTCEPVACRDLSRPISAGQSGRIAHLSLGAVGGVSIHPSQRVIVTFQVGSHDFPGEHAGTFVFSAPRRVSASHRKVNRVCRGPSGTLPPRTDFRRPADRASSGPRRSAWRLARARGRHEAPAGDAVRYATSPPRAPRVRHRLRRGLPPAARAACSRRFAAGEYPTAAGPDQAGALPPRTLWSSRPRVSMQIAPQTGSAARRPTRRGFTPRRVGASAAGARAERGGAPWRLLRRRCGLPAAEVGSPRESTRWVVADHASDAHLINQSLCQLVRARFNAEITYRGTLEGLSAA